MPTKIQIPAGGNPPATRVRKGQQCFWAAGGRHSYDVHLPSGAFVEFPSGGVIRAAEGGVTQTVTLSPDATAGTSIAVSFTKVAASTATTAVVASAVAGGLETDSSSTSSGQSDIIVDP